MSAKFNDVRITNLEASFMIGRSTVTATAAFVDTITGNTHGWTEGKGSVWSKDTMLALDNLRELMEKDLKSLHFSGEEVPYKEGPGVEQSFEGGLGEHLGSDDIKSV